MCASSNISHQHIRLAAAQVILMRNKLSCRRQTRHANKIEKSSTSTTGSTIGEQQKSNETTTSSPKTPTTLPSTTLGKATSSDDCVDFTVASEGPSKAMSKHKRRIRGESASSSHDKCAVETFARGNSFGSTDDVFCSAQPHKENEFQAKKKITRSQMRGMCAAEQEQRRSK